MKSSDRCTILWKVVLDQTDEATTALGARVRSLRQERGWTLKDLGREAGLSHPFLSQLERGLARPSVGSVERIARALGVPVGLLWSAPARGGLEVDLDGEIHALEEGDALLFDGGVPHRLRRTGGVATRALKVATPA